MMTNDYDGVPVKRFIRFAGMVVCLVLIIVVGGLKLAACVNGLGQNSPHRVTATGDEW